MDPAIVAFGLGVGLLVGMTGIGGGSLMTPLLILVFGVQPDDRRGHRPGVRRGDQDRRRLQAPAPEDGGHVAVDVDGVGSVPAAIGGRLRAGRPGALARRRLRRPADRRRSARRAAAVRHDDARPGRCSSSDCTAASAKPWRWIAATRWRAVGLGVFVGFVLGVTSAGSGAHDRRRPDPDVPPGAHPRGGHRRLPRRAAAVGRGAGAHRGRQRGLRSGGHHPARLGAGCVGGQPPVRARPDGGAADDPRGGAAGLGPGAAGEGRARRPRIRSRRGPGDRRGADGLEHAARRTARCQNLPSLQTRDRCWPHFRRRTSRRAPPPASGTTTAIAYARAAACRRSESYLVQR